MVPEMISIQGMSGEHNISPLQLFLLSCGSLLLRQHALNLPIYFNHGGKLKNEGSNRSINAHNQRMSKHFPVIRQETTKTALVSRSEIH